MTPVADPAPAAAACDGTGLRAPPPGGAVTPSHGELQGLPGDNPLGFLAALGVLAALDATSDARWNAPRLHWSDQPIPHPVVSPPASPTAIAASASALASRLLRGPALDPAVDPRLRLEPAEIREYLSRGRDAGDRAALAWCLVAEDSLDTNRRAKPTDLYFTAGQQKFITIARTILSETTDDEIARDVSTPWRYRSARESLMWDCADDRLHAYSAMDPSSSQHRKLTNSGAEALALIGLGSFPCFASPGRTLTQGCSGTWRKGTFCWPLWTKPATGYAVGSLLAHVTAPGGEHSARSSWYRAWGVSRVLQSQIRRSDQGGYGTFGPARSVWQRE